MRFNEKTKGINKTTNHEGEVAYKLTPELELYSLVCTSSLNNKFYTTTNDTIKRLRTLIKKVKPEFVAKLAVYARNEMYLRSIPLVLTVELAKIHNKDDLISRMTNSVIQRPDEITELLGYYKTANNKKGTKKLNKLSHQIQKGIALAFLKFDEYQLAKYNRAGDITLKDALFISHVNPSKEQELLYKKLIDNTLPTPYTWETELSASKDKKATWGKLMESRKMGYMATMRNLRNILDADVSLEQLKTVALFISNPEAVKRSKQLPFRFLSAYKELKGNNNPHTSMILNALEDAVITSAENIKGYDYNTSVLIACDVSGSMFSSISPKSKVRNYDVGLVLAMLLQNRCKSCITGIFGDIWKTAQLPRKAILQNVEELNSIEGSVGYSTNGYKVIDYLIEKRIQVDKIMIFTDNQMWNSCWGNSSTIRESWKTYKRLYPCTKLYLFDMAGYGNTPLMIDNNDVHLIAGWSDKMFGVLNAIEKGKTAIDEIDSIVL